MAWPTQNAWDQHLEEMNRRSAPAVARVSLVRVEGPISSYGGHVRHAHPYWQVDVCAKGGYDVEVEGERRSLTAENLFFIPPGNWHTYPPPAALERESWSVKFSVNGADEKYPPRSSGDFPGTGRLARWLIELAREGDRGDYVWQLAMERLLEACVEALYGDLRMGGHYSAVIRRVRMWVDQAHYDGRTVKVKELAAQAGCSATYLSQVFKSELGLPLKVFVDQRRFEAAHDLLTRTGLNISQTADKLGFEDVFSFSRFFKRMCGVSPRGYLKNCSPAAR